MIVVIVLLAFGAGLGVGAAGRNIADRRATRTQALNQYERREYQENYRVLREISRMARNQIDVEPILSNLVLEEIEKVHR